MSHLLLLRCVLAAGLPLCGAQSPPSEGRKFAILVGIDTYQHDEALARLGLAEADTKDLGATLQARGYEVALMLPGLGGDRGVSPLLPKDVLDQVEGMAKRSEAADTVLFYYSGHGFSDPAGKGYVCTVTTDPERLGETAVPLDRIVDALRGAKAKKRILILDACRKVVDRDVGVRPNLRVEQLRRAEGTGVLFSTSPGELSYEPTYGMRDERDRVIKNGLFTHFLLHGLGGDADVAPHDALVTLQECAQYTAQSFAALPNAPKQKPWLEWQGGAGDELLVCAAASQTVTAPTTAGIVIQAPPGSDDAPALATMLEPNCRSTGEVGAKLDRADWFKLQVRQPGVLRVRLHHLGDGGRLAGVRLVDCRGNQLRESHAAGIGSKETTDLPPVMLQDYTQYYFEVRAGAEDAAVPYELSTEFTPIEQPDVGEPNGAAHLATKLEPEGMARHWIGLRGDSQDYFAITAVAAGTLRVQVENLAPAEVHLAELQAVDVTCKGLAVAATHPGGVPAGGDGDTGPFSVGPGTYHVRVRPRTAADAAPYSLRTTFVPLAVADVGEPNNSRGKAHVAAMAQPVEATVGFGKDLEDWFAFVPDKHGVLRVTYRNVHQSGAKNARLGPLQIMTERGDVLFTLAPGGIDPEQEEASVAIPVAAGKRLLCQVVPHDKDQAAAYRIQVDCEEVASDEPPPTASRDSVRAAEAIDLPASVQRAVGYGNARIAFFRVEVPALGSLDLEVTNQHGDNVHPELGKLAMIQVLDAGGNSVLGQGEAGGVPIGRQKDRLRVDVKPGAYVFRIATAHELGAVPFLLEADFRANEP